IGDKADNSAAIDHRHHAGIFAGHDPRCLPNAVFRRHSDWIRRHDVARMPRAAARFLSPFLSHESSLFFNEGGASLVPLGTFSRGVAEARSKAILRASATPREKPFE